MADATSERSTSTDLAPGDQVVEITWNAVPFRADRFEELWRDVVEASLEYGATWYAFYRNQDDPWVFHQLMVFAEKIDFERYWYSDEIAEARAEAAGLFQVPILPIWLGVVGSGTLAEQPAER